MKKTTETITVNGRDLLSAIKREPTQTTDPKAERDRKMDELLSEMVDCFNVAFPTLSDLVKWLADANDTLFNNKGVKHAESAKGLTWWFGFDLLPDLIKAKTKEKRIKAITNALEETASNDRISKGMPLINYLIHDNNMDFDYDTEDWEKVKIVEKALDLMSELGAKYQDLKSEEDEQRAAEYEKTYLEKRLQEQKKVTLEYFHRCENRKKEV